MAQPIKIYTDGACDPNPGTGGWGFHAILACGSIIEKSGGEPDTTNNRMEMTAAIMALDHFAGQPGILLIHTDSQYLQKGVTLWMSNWKRNGWKTRHRKPVKNQDLWVRLDSLIVRRSIRWQWVRGHAGDPGNERADELATLGMQSL